MESGLPRMGSPSIIVLVLASPNAYASPSDNCARTSAHRKRATFGSAHSIHCIGFARVGGLARTLAHASELIRSAVCVRLPASCPLGIYQPPF